MDDFLRAVRASRKLHRGRASPPSTPAAFKDYVARFRKSSHIGHVVVDSDRTLLGVINLNEIVAGNFQSAYLGYYVFVPHEGRGVMTQGVELVLRRAFGKYRLHRVEANIMPHNEPSLRIVKRLGFRYEGFSPRYLKIWGQWRDHERWAITREDWRGRGVVPRQGE
jgi:ribosomal-protein-alanine N-acetyltransferase